MNIAAMFHAGLTVSDLERSITSYRDVLGFELVSRWDSAER
jgi:catechol 2,3-dioxygenase-like lactoylglutathione lyase family enzyme